MFTKSSGNVFISLLAYVDDIIANGNSLFEIESFKQFIKSKFIIKDLGKLKYFLEIEVLEIGNGLCLTKKKSCLDLITELA